MLGIKACHTALLAVWQAELSKKKRASMVSPAAGREIKKNAARSDALENAVMIFLRIRTQFLERNLDGGQV
jgi:hypothetical protein